jgi:hypothetical protein
MSAKAIDVVKPEPKTELELHQRWLNNLASSLMPIRSGVKKIEVRNG